MTAHPSQVTAAQRPAAKAADIHTLDDRAAPSIDGTSHSLADAKPSAAELSRRRRYVMLDAWRGVAASLVVLHHATAVWRRSATDLETPGRLLFSVGKYGWLGVPLFFVISGYCIAATADVCRSRTGGFQQYAHRRWRRIFPTYAAWLIVLTSALPVLELALPAASFWSQKERFAPISQIAPVEWLSNLFLVQTWFPRLVGLRRIDLTAVGWTLCYEVQFYAVMGALMLLVPRRMFAMAAWLTVALALLFSLLPALRWTRAVDGTFLDGRWLQFAAGIGVYYALVYASPLQRRALGGVLVAACLVGLWSGREMFALEFPLREKRWFEIGFASAFALVLLLLKSRDERWSLSRWARPLGALGMISFSLYLVHWPVCKVAAIGAWKAGLQSTSATWGVTVPLAFAASVVAAAVWFHLVERRFLNAA